MGMSILQNGVLGYLQLLPIEAQGIPILAHSNGADENLDRECARLVSLVTMPREQSSVSMVPSVDEHKLKFRSLTVIQLLSSADLATMGKLLPAIQQQSYFYFDLVLMPRQYHDRHGSKRLLCWG